MTPAITSDDAATRARQLAAVADPHRLRVLSVIAVASEAVTAGAVASALAMSRLESDRAITALVEGGLLEVEGGRAYTLTPDAWFRFGRMLDPARGDGEGSGRWSLPVDIRLALDRVVEQLTYRYSAFFSRESVEGFVFDSYELLRDRASVTQHLVTLTNRYAADRLAAVASSRGLMLRGVPELLFVCVRNAGRSQLAAAHARSIAGNRIHVRTAGSSPASAIDPVVAQVLEEDALPIVAEFPKPLTDEVVLAADIVITMGCGDSCPVYPGRRYLDWEIQDPVGAPIEEIRLISAQVRERVHQLLASIGVAS